jgi:hypothetical protein
VLSRPCELPGDQRNRSLHTITKKQYQIQQTHCQKPTRKIHQHPLEIIKSIKVHQIITSTTYVYCLVSSRSVRNVKHLPCRQRKKRRRLQCRSQRRRNIDGRQRSRQKAQTSPLARRLSPLQVEKEILCVVDRSVQEARIACGELISVGNTTEQKGTR